MKKYAVLILVLAVLLSACGKPGSSMPGDNNPNAGDGPAVDDSSEDISESSSEAAVSGTYRNVFKEFGKSDAEITEKVNASWNKLFNGSETEKIYYEVASDMAYILDTGNNDVRSEGMSYGMMICVQLNKKTEFDRLWKWAKTYMYNETNTSSNSRGYFTWQLNTNGSVKGQGIAPDGEFYFTTALLFAAARWGNRSGIFNYGHEARQLLYDMCHRKMGNPDPWDEPALFRRPGDHRNPSAADISGYYMPVFSPIGASGRHTDPSYHLSAFYEVWAEELENDWNQGQTSGIWSSLAELKTDVDFYKQAAQTSRIFFHTTVNSVTGLGPDYANFDGSPTGGEHADFRFDAWRIAMNIAMDYAWWKADSWQAAFADKIQAFFVSKGVTSYGNQWKLDGTAINTTDHSPGLVACNAVASLAASHEENAWKFIEDFWNINMTTGTYRYYDGCLYMLGMLHLSGNFKAYFSNFTGVRNSGISPANAVFDKRADLQSDITVNMSLNGNTLSNIKNGAVVLASGTQYTVSGSTVTINKTYLATQPVGTTTLVFTFSAGAAQSLVITVKETPEGTGGGGLIKYDFTTDTIPAGYPKYSGSGTLSAEKSGGVLVVTKSNSNNSTIKFILPFDLGAGNLANYSKIELWIRGVSGDISYKTFKVEVGSSTLASGSVNLGKPDASAAKYTINFSSGAWSSYTGEVEIGFLLENTQNFVYEIKSIELIP